jgi:Carboxypeptidase regulatory-like domain
MTIKHRILRFANKIIPNIAISLFAILISICVSANAQTFSGTTTAVYNGVTATSSTGALPSTIPDATSGCGKTISAAGTSYSCVNVPVSGATTTLSTLNVSFTIGADPSTYIGDYGIVLKAPGGSPSMTLMGQPGAATPFAGGCGDSSDMASGTVITFADTGGSLPAAAASVGAAVSIPTGSYAPSLGNVSPNGTLAATFGGMTPAAQNGTWQMCFYDVSGTDTVSIAGVSLNLLHPTAGEGVLTGRVKNPYGRGISGASLHITDIQTGEVYKARTNQRGYFRVENLAVGDSYVVSTTAKTYNFDTVTFTLNEEFTGIEIYGY